MNKCYTIPSITDIPLVNMDRVQFTENSRTFPTSRRTTEHLQKVRQEGCKTPILIHWDFVYIVSRYAMMSDSYRKAVCIHLTNLLKYAEHDPGVEGIIMHTDWPIAKEVIKAQDPVAYASQYYQGKNMWNVEAIRSLLATNEDVLITGLCMLRADLMQSFGRAPRCKILLENTVHLGPNSEGSVGYFQSLFNDFPELTEFYGLCYDTEHEYAATGKWWSIDEVEQLKSIIGNVAVHLNVVPSEVKPKSRKDRHSLNTIEECSLNTSAYYKAYASALDALGVPWVREVKQETIERELICLQ